MAALAGGDSGGASPPPPPPPPPASASKGKAKMDDEAEAEAEGAGKMCGICYAQGRSTIRGELDCCAHYFCFVCIMAWGRVESRCPFCKARFRTIRRPPVPGRFPAERVVSVPERNQVYHPGGNVSSTVGGDPYSETICSVCSCPRDDELLLLCELCDSAAHTYCAGLGTVVPEGDWFCKDCAVTREEHLRCQAENEGWEDGQGEFEVSIDVPRAEPVASSSVSDVVDEDYAPSSVDGTIARSSRLAMDDPVPSIYDIVGEDYTTNAGSNRYGRSAEGFPLQGTSAGSQSPESTRGRDNGLAAYHARIRLEVERARTLRNSRNLDKRIRELRENWTALRDGSVGFAAHVPNERRKDTAGTISIATKHQHCAIPIVIGKKNAAAATSVQLSSVPFSEEITSTLGHGSKILHKDTRDARKAWKKLEMAKSSGGRNISNKPSSLNCSPPFSMGNKSTSYSPIDTILGQKNKNMPNKVTQKNIANCGHDAKMESTPPTKYSGECHSLLENSHASVHERKISFQNQINQESLNGKVASSIHDQHVNQTLESSCSTSRSEKFKLDMLHPLKCSLSSGPSTDTSSLQLGPRVGSQSTLMVNPVETSAVYVATINEIGSAATTEVRESSRPDRHERKRKLSSEKCHDQGSKRSRSTCKIAKSEISSLAIRKLKQLKIDKTYGSDRFKEVARAATHTVLAAYGFEHSASQSLALPKPICKHSPEVQSLKSSVITDACRGCLRNFVKEVTSLVLSGRQMDQTGASC